MGFSDLGINFPSGYLNTWGIPTLNRDADGSTGTDVADFGDEQYHFSSFFPTMLRLCQRDLWCERQTAFFHPSSGTDLPCPHTAYGPLV